MDSLWQQLSSETSKGLSYEHNFYLIISMLEKSNGSSKMIT